MPALPLLSWLPRAEAGAAHKQEAAALAAAAEREKEAELQQKAALKEQVVADRAKVKQAQVRGGGGWVLWVALEERGLSLKGEGSGGCLSVRQQHKMQSWIGMEHSCLWSKFEMHRKQ
jgi:hypothetical protein